MNKQCKKCNDFKKLTEFYYQNDKPNAICKKCNLQRVSLSREKRLDQDRITKSAYAKANKEKISKDNGKWRSRQIKKSNDSLQLPNCKPIFK